MTLRYLVFSFTLIALSGCANIGDRNGQATNMLGISPPPQISNTVKISVVGVEIHFEDTNGWFHNKTQMHPFRFLKYIEQKRMHSAMIVVYPVFPPRTQFKNLDDFYNYSKTNLELLRDRNGKDIEFEIGSSSEKAPLCTTMHKKTRKIDETNAPGTEFVLDAYEYVCKHPYRPNVFVNLHYSERFQMTDNITDVRSRAEAMFKRITFSE